MCGINGIFAYHYAANPVDRAELEHTRDHMTARGPDGMGEWIAGDGRIHRIEHNTQPFSLDTISSGVPVRAVLEVNGGTARKLAIMPGDKVIHKLFGNRP